MLHTLKPGQASLALPGLTFGPNLYGCGQLLIISLACFFIDLDWEDELAGKRVTRILTDDFPRYFALVTKVREEKQMVGEEGLILSSTVVPQVQAVFPKGAVNKSIKVGLQVSDLPCPTTCPADGDDRMWSAN